MNKTRTLLVLLSIAVGVTAIGMVMGSQIIVDQSLPEQYTAVNPASGTIFTLTTFDEDMVRAIADMDEVGEVEARRFTTVRFQTKEGEWRNMQLTAVPDFEEMNINKLVSEEGVFPPPEEGLLIERASLDPSLGLDGYTVGDRILIEPTDGKQREISFDGTVHDISQLPAFINGSGYGYVSFDTLKWMGEPQDFNILVYRPAENELDQEHVEAVGKQIQERLEKSGTPVLFVLVFPPGEHPAQNFLDVFSLILGAMGLLSLILGGFLIVNTLSAILTQQVRQIGIMKSIGARTGQVSSMYVMMVLMFGLFSLVIAIPLGAVGAVGLASIFAGLLNFDIGGFQLFPQVVLVQTVIALLAPVLAASIPIMRGVKVTVREAISEQGLGKGHFGQGFLDKFVLNLRYVIPMQRPQHISLRNTFRRKGRLALTLLTLSLASAIFMAIFSVRASLQQTLDDALVYFDYDVQVVFDQPYRTERIRREVEYLPGVEGVETWGFGTARRIRPDETDSESIFVYAPEPDSNMLNPTLIEGRWLQEGDTNAMVVNTDILRAEEDMTLGSQVTMDLNGRESEWVVVGIVRGTLTGANAFVNYDYFSRVTKEAGRAQISLVRLDDRTAANQLSQGQLIEEVYRDNGFRVQQMQTISQFRTILNTVFNIVIVFLLFMAVLLGVVGGLGLMGTMSINVIERTREIGVMRAIGASDWAVLLIVLLEGIVIGLISWIIGGLAAIPASRAMASAVGQALLRAEPSYTFSVSGAFLWLFIVLLLAIFASYLPARSASRLTVREVLSYE